MERLRLHAPVDWRLVTSENLCCSGTINMLISSLENSQMPVQTDGTDAAAEDRITMHCKIE